MLLFVDDNIMVVVGKSVNDLQQSFDLSKQYCDKWELEVNILKSKTMAFRKRADIFEKWYFDDFNHFGSCFKE